MMPSIGNSRLKTIKIEAKCRELDEPWAPIDLLRVNDQVVRMALFQGEYHWHKHSNEDELIYVYKGTVTIRLRKHESIQLSEGEMLVIPKNMEHRPESSEPSYVMMFEPHELKSKGD